MTKRIFLINPHGLIFTSGAYFCNYLAHIIVYVVRAYNRNFPFNDKYTSTVSTVVLSIVFYL